MDFDDLVEHVPAPDSRAGKALVGIENKLHEGAVMAS